MSCDGSSAKSYIRHATEKERLDNLAFASFPEDYLPYAATSGHQRAAAPPPYLLWGDDRRRRPTAKRRNPKCAGALLCAIALVIFAILAVVAISVYLGVVTNLFRSPVISVSGRFQASEDFSEELLNSSSSKFLEKVEIYQAKVEKAFLSSPLEPAFIAARIYSFRPGMVVFFRVYLDRRKIVQEDEESPPTELVRDLITQKLTSDPDSVHVEENEELLAVELRPPETVHPPMSTTSKPSTERNGHQRPPATGGVGQWRPVPIEDSVSPSFADRPVGGISPVRSPEEIPRRNPAEGFGAVRVLDSTPTRNPTLSGNNQEGIGTVRVLEESPVRNTQLAHRDGTGPVRLLQESPPKSPQLSGISSISGSKESPVKNPLFTSDRVEGVGSVRLLPESPIEAPQLPNLPLSVGSIRATDTYPQPASVLPGNSGEGVGSVRLIEESPVKDTQFLGDPRAGIGTVGILGDTPPRKLSMHRKPSEGFVRSVEEPPTLAPSVSLVVRNRTRSDKPRNLLTRLEKGQEDSGQNVGVGSIREIITEGEPPVFASRLSEAAPENTSESDSVEQNRTTEIIADNKENIKLQSQDISTEIPLTTQNELLHSHNKTENSEEDIDNFSQKVGDLVTSTVTSAPNETETDRVLLKQTQPPLFKNSLENILFSHPPSSFMVTDIKKSASTSTEATSAEYIPFNDSVVKMESKDEPPENPDIVIASILHEMEALQNETLSPTTEDSEKDVHSSIVNYSQYLYPEPHYHTIANERNESTKETFDLHTLEGHGFHKPPNTTNAATSVKLPNIESTTPVIPSKKPTTENPTSPNASTKEVITVSTNTVSTSKPGQDVESPTQHPFESVEITNTTLDVNETLLTDETANITSEDAPQQGKVVPQLQADLISNDIGEGQSNEEGDEKFEDEILRHITTIHPVSNSSDIFVQSCPSGSVACNESGEGCGVHCDMRKDCPNNEDEKGCLCSDLLRAMGQSQKICDGVDDCSDRSDETNCSWCPSADYFRCPGSRACVPMDRVCDGKDDCPGAHDERRCVNLAETSSGAESYEYRSEGYLIVRRNGQWGKLCLDSLNRLQDHETRIRELGKAVCSTLTYRNMTSSVRAQDKDALENSYYQISAETSSSKSGTSIFVPTPCKKKEVLRVQCTTLECGLRPSAKSTQRRRIVGGRSADGAGSWPWAAALYREGDFQCGAALISDIWLVSAGHCFYSSRTAYWTVRLGVLRRGSELLSSEEQVRRIQNIILHPQYEDIGFINDIALLKMDRPVTFSDSLRPICLPSSPAEDASLWHGRRCTVVGWGKLYEIGHTFPDSLQEVRLPVISSVECQKRSIFLPAYRITPNMFCAGYDRGGRDACLGDSGGPMACQRPADGRWILLGVTSNGDGCGRPGRPGVYSQVAGFLTWIHEAIATNKGLSGDTGSESTCSKGVRCRLGRCVPQTRVCDGRRDCAGGEDEDGC